MGCKANLTDSQSLEARLQRLGGVAVPEGEAADLFLLNSCTVTDQADKEAKQILKKSNAKFSIAAGCLAEVNPSAFEGNAAVLRNSAKDQLENIVIDWLDSSKMEALIAGDRVAWHKKILENFQHDSEIVSSHRTRAFYKVQDGCNAFCAYCVIPLARGRSRSLPASQIVKEIQKIVDMGVKEVAITAIHAADYESEGLDFTALIEKILKETSTPRIRLTSLDPKEIPDRLIDLMKINARICPHFHISLQSTSETVLKNMKRDYGVKEIEDRFFAIQRGLPHAYVGLDLIAGFPGESEGDFLQGIALLEKIPFTKAHVFPYSIRKNTAAARMVEAGLGVPQETIQKRAKVLRELSEKKFQKSLEEKVGSVAEVLVEEKRLQVLGRNCSTGHARNFHKVIVPGLHTPNETLRVKIVGVFKDSLKGEKI
jgi:threonylcarbamoyladenosine tRNA methylthiotransferase MtaB